MSKLKIVASLLTLCFTISVCCNVVDVSAAMCKDISLSEDSNYYNPSLYNACNGGGADGAMWVSSSESSTDVKAVVDYNGVNETIDVYMHGVVIDNNGDDRDKANATCVKVFTLDEAHGRRRLPNDNIPSKLPSGLTPEQIDARTINCYGADAYNSYPSPLKGEKQNVNGHTMWKIEGLDFDGQFYGSYLERTLAKRGEKVGNSLTSTNATTPIKSSVKKVKLNVGSLIQGKECIIDGDACVYEDVSVMFFRCWGGNEAIKGKCYSEESTIRIKKPVPSSFVGTSVAMTQKDAKLDDCRLGINGCRVVDYDAAHRWKPESGSTVREYTVNDTLILSDCDPVSGCEVTFRHYLIRTVGVDEAKYVIYREGSFNSNTGVLTTSGLVTGKSLKVRKGEWDTITMYPGQKVCERLEFRADGKSPVDYPEGKTTSTVCAVAVGGTESSIDVKVRDAANGSLYGNWSNGPIYAKPDDPVMARGILTPKVQAWYERTIFGIDGTIGANFNRDNEPDWQNAFSIKVGYESMDGASCAKTFSGNRNSSDSSDLVGDYDRVVTMSDVGETIAMQAVTNCDDGGKNTPKRVDVIYNDRSGGNGEFSSEVNIDSLESNDARIMVPYNFKNVPEINNIKYEVSAGENVSMPYAITTKLKSNELVGGDSYATIVRGAQWKAGVCTDENDANTCVWYESGKGDLHDDISRTLEETKKTGYVSATIPDLPAGTERYVRVAVYPKDSGPDNNLRADFYDPNDYDSWAYSDAATVMVVKKPSFQVWGGDVFVEKGVNVPLANKTVLDGYSLGSVDLPRKFGSWGELSVETGFGYTGDLFSGAALGFAGNVGGELSPKYSFLDDVGYGNNEPRVGNPGGKETNNTDSDNKGALNYSGGSGIDIDEFVKKISKKIGNDDKKEVGGDSKIGDLESEGLNFGPNAKKMYVSDGDIIINKDIMYNGEYETLDSIPKVIIYANNIKIDCSVERIDAVLIAKGNIETCPFAEGDEKKNNLGSPARSAQLRINGAVIAGGQVSFDRSYGAGTGANSMIPAEIINMDPSWYLWACEAMETSGADEANEDSGLMMPTYVNELPPRY